jgi:hypothetical protein
VELVDRNSNQEYEVRENFRAGPLADLDLFLVSQQDKSRVICSSQSRVDNVEHFFCPIPVAGLYQIQVKHQGLSQREKAENYAVSWWTVPE